MNLYFDNGTTSYPKPIEVVEAMRNFALNCGGSYGRSSHRRAYDATVMVEDCRELMGRRMGLEDGLCVAWASNATMAANVIISSLDLRGKEVLVSPLEHNCVMRPLQAAGAIIKVMPSFADGRIDTSRLESGKAVLAVINHQSNVNGVIQPIDDIRQILTIPLMIDTAQSLGGFDVDVSAMDYAIFTGHKGLMGPTGIGGLFVRDYSTLAPLIYGGTGSNSKSFDMPTNFPDFLEAGTHNTYSIAGLKAALECKLEVHHSKSDFLDFITAVRGIDNIEVFCAADEAYQGELFSFRHRYIDGSIVAYGLSEIFDIECRFGLQCSVLAHNTLGTTDSGVVRVSPSKFHTVTDFEYFVKCLTEIIRR